MTKGSCYTTHHEVVPRPYKICDWLLKSSRDHFGLHQRKQTSQSIMEFELPKRHILRPTLSTDMVQRVLMGERQKGALVETCKDPWHKMNVNIRFEWFFSWEEKRTQWNRKEWSSSIFFFFQICPFWTYIKKFNTFTFWCVVIPLSPHSIYTYWGGPKGFVNGFFEKLDHGSWTMGRDHLP